MTKDRRFKIFSGVVLAFFLLFAFEIFSRMRINTDLSMWMPDPKLVYRLMPGWSGRYLGFPMRINSKGIRDREYPYEKRNSVFRIIALGDSYTFGFGIRDIDDTYPKVAEQFLLKEFSNVEIINLGISAFNTEQEIEWFKMEGTKYDPDMVIIGFVLNDNEGPASDPDFINWLISHNLLDLKEFIRKNIYSINYAVGVFQKVKSMYLRPDFKVGDYDGCIDRIVDFSRYLEGRDIKLMVFLIPYLCATEEYPFTNIHNYVMKNLQKKNILCYDTRQHLKKYEAKVLWNSWKDRHPNELCHRYMAEFISEKIKEVLRDVKP